MMAYTRTLEGTYYEGEAPEGVRATLSVIGEEASLNGEGVSLSFKTRLMRVSPRIGRAPRFIALPGGGQIECENLPYLDRLPQEVRSEGPVAWLEERPTVAALSVALIVALLTFGYFIGLPAVAERVTARIPFETEKMLGDEILGWLDEKQFMEPTEIDEAMQKLVTDGFKSMVSGLQMEQSLRVLFRHSPMLGPNAIALPGGTIIITDQMIEKAESEDEILAVLAHEAGHVERRHVLRQLLQGSVLGVAVAAITSDASSVSVAMAGLPVLLLKTKYSRKFEDEADDFAFDLLEKNAISPGAFASIMERIDKKGKLFGMGYVSSHPETSERAERARRRADAMHGTGME